MDLRKAVLILFIFKCLSACERTHVDRHAPASSKSGTLASGALPALYASARDHSPPGPIQPTVTQPRGYANSAAAAAFTFATPQQYQPIYASSYEDFSNVWIADVTGDGRSDVVATSWANNHKINVFTQQPDGSLSGPAEHMFANAFAVADFNEDGVSDVLFLDYQNLNLDGVPKIGALVSNGQGGLQRIVAYSDLLETYHMAWTSLDVNGDGHIDLVGAINLSYNQYPTLCTEPLRQCGGYRVLLGDGKGTFRGNQVFMLGIARSIFELDAVDLNDDGRKDLVIPMAGAHPMLDPSGNVLVAYALPSGGLATPTLLHDGYGVGPGQYLTFADVTGDGIVDSIHTPPDQQDKPVIRQRLLDNTFSYWAELWTYRILPGLILAEDFDGDRKADLVSSQILSWGLMGLGYYQQSNGALLAPTYTQTTQMGSIPFHKHAMAAGDYNGDGCKDVIIAATTTGLFFFAGSNCVAAPRVIPNEAGYVREGMPTG